MAKRARVKVKSSHVTRAQAVAEFERKKAKQRRQLWKKRVLISSGVALVAYGVVGGWWCLAWLSACCSCGRLITWGVMLFICLSDDDVYVV